MVEIAAPKFYTEVQHTVYTNVEGAELIPIESRRFRPERITVKYALGTHVNDGKWKITAIELGGPWIATDGVTPTGEGSGHVGYWFTVAPEWAREFATANRPQIALVEN